MKKPVRYLSLLPVYLLILGTILGLAVGGSRAVTVWTENAPVTSRKTVIIDAGHGGPDGGATSCTGVLESKFNLEIALRLRDLTELLGIQTLMIRDTDCSVYTQGNTIAQKKVSDLKERVRIVNNTENATLVSIHQNLFPDAKYSGAQVFYAKTQGSQKLAKDLQIAFIKSINQDSHRQAKKADGIYLMQKINCTGVLIECGFLSNPKEEYLLRNASYQKRLCSVIATSLSNYLFDT